MRPAAIRPVFSILLRLATALDGRVTRAGVLASVKGRFSRNQEGFTTNVTAPSTRPHQRRNVVSAAILASLLTLVASHAEATVYGDLSVGLAGWSFLDQHRFPNPTKSESPVLGEVYGTKTLSYSTLAVASVEGDLRLGTLRASAVTDYAPTSLGPQYAAKGWAIAGITMSDSVTFSNVQPGQVAFLDLVVAGHFSQDPEALIDGSGPGTASATYSVSVFQQNLSFESINLEFRPNPVPLWSPCTNYYDACIIDNNPSAVRILPFSLSNGTYGFGWRLKVGTTAGASADFSHTALAYLRLPDGVTFTSASGAFLAEAVPLPQVPEPSTGLLVLAGLGGLALRQRRRG